MKTLNKIWVTGLFAIAVMLLMPNKTKAQEGDISFQTFYDDLSPYGTWVNDSQYGDVWVPDAGPDFRPYATNGHWAVTSYGNTWVSDYEWGWAPFHYGRWRFDDYYGWVWIPDYEWGPAWVNWRTGGDYYGWAPLGPGISVDFAIGGGYNIPDNYWVFAPRAYITSPRIYDYYVPRTRVVSVIHNTTIINNIYVNNSRRYVSGPPVRDIQRYTHSRVNVYNINNSSRPGSVHIQNNTINIYRPAVRHDNNARPQRVVDGNAYRNANPTQRIAGGRDNHQNAGRLANYARTATPDNKVVHENHRPDRPAGDNNRPAVATPTPNAGSSANPGNRNNRPNVPRTDGQPTPVNRPGQPVQNDNRVQRDQQRQQRDQQQRQQMDQQQAQQRQQQMEQRQQQRQQREQNSAQNQQADQQRQQQAQERQQRMQQRQQQQNQQADQQRQQQQAQQRQQMDQQRQQQQAQQRQQMEQQRQQQQQQQRQQMDQQRQQQQQQQRQQMEQQRQQQQQQQRQQMDQQRQQQQHQQQRQQMEQQRQQQMQQQRQQQQQQPQQQERPHRPHE